MERIVEEELADVARVVEVTSDAVLLCALDGAVLHVNRQLLELMKAERERVVGTDVKDILYSTSFERSDSHGVPFADDASETTLMLKLPDGSFIPVRVRALRIGGSSARAGGLQAPERLIVAVRSLEERYASDRKTRRLLSELQAANKRLAGTLSVIMSTVGTSDMPTLLDTVLNRMAEALDAAGTVIYFAEGGGFKLRGVSRGMEGSYVPDFIPYGAGVATHVLREQRACRLSVVPADAGESFASGSFYDLDARSTHRLRIQDMPPFKTLIAVPVYFGTQVLGTIELGWTRPHAPRKADVRVLEVICDYLSIELVGLVTSVRASRTAELARSLNHVRELFFEQGDRRQAAWAEMLDEVRRMLSCRILPVYLDAARGVYVVDFEGGSRIDIPGGVEGAFFSETAPAARVGAGGRMDFMRGDAGPLGGAAAPQMVRLSRVERGSRAGAWLEYHDLPCQGVFIDLGIGISELSDAPVSAAEHELSVASTLPTPPSRMMLLLRDGTQEPIDDMEFDYLTHMAHDFELVTAGARRQESERHIAQTLQAGMRSSLGEVPGITADSLYSSATSQALVGGDFYTLIRMPDEQAVMILGDVSGKGIEAASMSALVKTALAAYAWEGLAPARMARSLNSMLMSFSRVETFVTVFIARIDLRARQLRYCSAGHPPTMLLHAPGTDAAEVELLSVQSGVVGAFENMVYEEGVIEFLPGDMLFMYTDGALEARDASGGFFGEQRLRDVLLRASDGGIEGLCDQVLAELDTFTSSALDDDIALVALRFDGMGE